MADDEKSLFIRSSAGEFLIYETQEQPDSIQVRYRNETLWMTQSAMAELFGADRSVISKHIAGIYDSDELERKATCAKFAQVQTEGGREVTRKLDFYNLDVIISVGYRVNSKRATQFRRWATQVLREFTIEGCVLDQERMENGQLLGIDYFEKLLKILYGTGGLA